MAVPVVNRKAVRVRILVTIACLLLGLAVALPSGAAVGVKKPCKPKTAKKCKAAAKPKPKPPAPPAPQQPAAPAANTAPTARFSFSPAAPTTGQTVSFDGSASSDADGSIASFAWSFGDSATAAGPTASRPYSQAGSFTVTLTVTDDKGATGSATQTVPVVAAPPPVAAAEYTFGAGVTQQAADEIRAGVDRAVAYYAKIGAVPSSIRVRGYADAESTALAYSSALAVPVATAREIWASSIAVATPAGIFINIGAQYWRDTTPTLRAKVIAHELFHRTQEELAGSRWGFGPPDTVPGGGPRWLIEGSAEVMGFVAVADSGMLAFERARAEQIATSKFADPVPLRTWENLTGINAHPKAAYNLFFVAAEYLTRDRGRTSLLEFWRAIGAGQGWEAAFASAFGRTPEAFYSDFESYRRTL